MKQYKVKYVITSRIGEKVILVKTVDMNCEELLGIGNQIQIFLKMYKNVNVLFKVISQ